MKRLWDVIVGRTLEWPVALFWRTLAAAITATSRVTVEGTEPDGAAVVVNWHRYQSLLIWFHGRRRRWMLVSPSPKLTPVARYCRLCGLRLVRGTSGQRGKEALEELKALLQKGESVVLAVDGPHGPIFRAKRGCVDLARSAGVPIIPVSFRCSRAYEFRWRWDRTLLPLPGSQISFVYGPPIAADGTDEEVLAAVEQALNALDARADEPASAAPSRSAG